MHTPTHVRFKVSVPVGATQWGEYLAVCGSAHELGKWSASGAMRLELLPGGSVTSGEAVLVVVLVVLVVLVLVLVGMELGK